MKASEKEITSKWLALYRLLHRKSVKSFISPNPALQSISISTYTRMMKEPQSVSEAAYQKLLNIYGLRFETNYAFTLLAKEIVLLHENVLYFRQEKCCEIIEAMLRKLEKHTSYIDCVIINYFLLQFKRYMTCIKYLGKDDILAFMEHCELFGSELSDIVCFYCVYSSTKVSYAFEKELYEMYSSLHNRQYLPIQVHRMAMFEHQRDFETVIVIGKRVLQSAMQINNHVMLYEYYDCMLGYYVQFEKEKVENTMKIMYDLANQVDFPVIKKKQFYENYARYSMKQGDY